MLRYDGRRKELKRNVVIAHISKKWYKSLLILIALGELRRLCYEARSGGGDDRV
jgi:hypothetical protein